MVHLRAKIILALRFAAIACALVIIVGSLLPNNAGLPTPRLSDKLNHVIGYGVLTALGVMAWRHRDRLICVGLIFVQSGMVEILQAAMRLGRTGGLDDMVANVIGIGLGTVAGLIGVIVGRWILSHPVFDR